MPFTQQIINSDKLQGILDIPEEFKGRNVKILLISIDDDFESGASDSTREELFNRLNKIWVKNDDVSIDALRKNAWRSH